MIKYIGSKRLLLPALRAIVAAIPDARTVLDLFSGTARVGHAWKTDGLRVLANDHNAFAATLARCYVAADREDVLADATRLVAELNRLPGTPGWFTRTYCEEARYLQPKNGARVEAIRSRIAELALEPELEAVLLVSLMEAADRVDSTTGLQMAYLKQWSARSFQDLELRVPQVLPRATAGKGEAHRLDAIVAARTLGADVAYLDPPYNQHSYLGNYHVWETLVAWDRPEVYGVARKRVECKERKSVFNAKRSYRESFRELVHAVQAPTLVVSFNDEGYLPRPQIEEVLAERGAFACVERDYKRYVGAQIGIYNGTGAKVGKISHLRNTELIYVVGEPGLVAVACAAGRESFQKSSTGTKPSPITTSQHVDGP